jgi:hypothetical protein
MRASGIKTGGWCIDQWGATPNNLKKGLYLGAGLMALVELFPRYLFESGIVRLLLIRSV